MQDLRITINGKPMVRCDRCGEVISYHTKPPKTTSMIFYKNGKPFGLKSVMVCYSCEQKVEEENFDRYVISKRRCINENRTEMVRSVRQQ